MDLECESEPTSECTPKETSPGSNTSTTSPNPIAAPHPSSPAAMDLECESAPTSKDTPKETSPGSNTSTNFPGGQSPPTDRTQFHTKEVDEVVSRPSQLTEDAERESKRPRLREVRTMIPVLNTAILRDEPYWMKPEWRSFLTTEKGAKVSALARIAGKAMQEQLHRMRLNARIERGEYVSPEEAKGPSDDAGGLIQYVVLEYKRPREILTFEEFRRFLESPLQQGQAKLPEGLPCSNNPPGEYCMSDEFIEHLDKKAQAYFSRKKEMDEEEIIANGLQSMDEEAFLAFRNYVAENDLVEGFDYGFGEVLHHCFSVEEYRKVYCHYNFTIKMKKNDEVSWTSKLYFAEAKLVHGVKYYFCSPLLPTDDGQCYSCTNQHVVELKHPSGRGYEKGHEASGSHYPSDASSYDDDECGGIECLFS